MPPTTPYTGDLGGREPLAAIRESVERVRALTGAWTTAHFERTYAPGKWSARHIFIHLAQTEMALGNRARMALIIPGYTAQSFDQDQWIARESHLSGPDAVGAFLALARMNLVLFDSLSPADRQIALAHPEYGSLTVDWIIHQMAGHQRHHLAQLDTIASR
jgi:hypothetical protein